jgi:hypothetical protein
MNLACKAMLIKQNSGAVIAFRSSTRTTHSVPQVQLIASALCPENHFAARFGYGKLCLLAGFWLTDEQLAFPNAFGEGQSSLCLIKKLVA